MPDPQAYIGAIVTAFVPDDARAIDLGYTDVRFYFASSEDGTYVQASSSSLFSGQKDYEYNKTDALETDWWRWALFGATPGEGPLSEPMPVGPLRCTRLTVRQGVGKRLRILETAAVTAGTDANTVVCSSLIDLDASPAKYANRYARALGGNVDGQTKRVRSASNSGYVPASGTLNFGNDFGSVPNTSVSLELWRPARDDDPSEIIDDAMQRVRARMWWEETFLLTTDAGIADYAMPLAMLPGSIKSVDYAALDYPQAPGWRPVGWWDLSMDLQQPMLSIYSDGILSTPYSSGKVIRVVFNRFGDRMDSDTDYWRVNQDWAIAETAYEYLKAVATPGGGREDLSDAAAAKKELLEECMLFRATYMPQARGHVRTAR